MKPNVTETVSDVPDEVRGALEASGKPFEPVGTLKLNPHNVGKPAVVVIMRKGSPLAQMLAYVDEALILADRLSAPCYVTFESKRIWKKLCAEFNPRH